MRDMRKKNSVRRSSRAKRAHGEGKDGVESLEKDSSSQESDHVWKWYSGAYGSGVPRLT